MSLIHSTERCFFLHKFEDVGQAGDRCSLEHLFRLPWKARCRNVFDEFQEKAMITPLSLQVCRDELFRTEGCCQNVDPVVVNPYPLTLLVKRVYSVAAVRDFVDLEFRGFIFRGGVEEAAPVSSG